MPAPVYPAISFAPVQGFIEKSRKLRDLYGASQILSYLSQKLIEDVEDVLGKGSVISPALIDVQEGMPNRILVKGHVERTHVQTMLLRRWQHLLTVCREWVEQNVPADYHWSQKPDQVGKEKGEWERWGSYTWEVFWGTGDSPSAAMDDLETRKLKRDWVAINWMGESSSLSGTDAIAWPGLGRQYKSGGYQPGQPLSKAEQQEVERFYLHLAWILDGRRKSPLPPDEEMKKQLEEDGGKFITHRERLSIPELAKRLVTLPALAQRIGISSLDEKFSDIYREAGYWSGWFMGDGDKVGDKLKVIAKQHADDSSQRDAALNKFTEYMRKWGEQLKDKKDLFAEGKGRIVYAGGDDFMGVLYSENTQTAKSPEKLKPIEAWNWLLKLPKEWEKLQEDLKSELNLDFTYSVGFVWAGHQVPQRDILQHCREAEKRAKSLGRNRVTIRVVFNNGQKVEWTCPWDHLNVLNRYQDRDGGKNWTHLYNDWQHLKSRHAIRLDNLEKKSTSIDVALTILDLYFDKLGQEIQRAKEEQNTWNAIVGSNTDEAIVQWIDGLVQVGWQLCSNI